MSHCSHDKLSFHFITLDLTISVEEKGSIEESTEESFKDYVEEQAISHRE